MLASGNDLIVQVKDNQPKLHAAIARLAASQPPRESHVEQDPPRRGRRERREVRVFALAPDFGHDHWQGRLRLAIEVRRLTQERARTLSRWRVRNHTTHYYLSSAEFSAKDCADYVRQHWHIENRLHYVLDQSLGEDAARIRRNPGVFAALRHFALNLMRSNGEQCIAAALYDNALCLDKPLSYKGIR